MTLSEFAIELPALRDEAKAKWGDKYHGELNYYSSEYKDSSYENCDYTNYLDYWQYHLNQMLTSDNPVKYLKDHSGKEA